MSSEDNIKTNSKEAEGNAPATADYKDLKFDYNQKMVNWFSIPELARAGIQAALSSAFGSYADNREIQALRDKQATSCCEDDESKEAKRKRNLYYDKSGDDEIWLDYIADLGDGWDSTYTMACLMAEKKLDLHNHKETTLQRGSVLIMGGDQVYPTASREEYKNRLWGPYESALPDVKDGEPRPALFALPGNHDWYDGLTSFTRLFFQDRRLGGWQTEQKRSYFAIKLSEDWWLWGIDTQLEADLDKPQLDYFRQIAAIIKSESHDGKEVNIITCVPEPEWLLCQKVYKGVKAYDNLAHIERRIIKPNKLRHRLSLAGDLHAYARYESKDRTEQRIMAGGGGAYLYPTHKFPEEIHIPQTERGDQASSLNMGVDEDTGQASIYPSAETSRKIAFGAVYKFFYKCWSFSLLFGFTYFVLAWFMYSTSKTVKAIAGDQNVYQNPTLENVTLAILHSPLAVIASFTFLLLCYFFTQSRRWQDKIVWSAFHFGLHFGAIVCLLQLHDFMLSPFKLEIGSFPYHAVFLIFMLVFGTLLAGLIIGFYLWFSHLFGHTNENEVFACQSLTSHKNFLRLHIANDGTLTVYPIGVETVCDKWTLKKFVDVDEPIFKPEEPSIPDRAHLIEKPIVLKPIAPKDGKEGQLA